MTVVQDELSVMFAALADPTRRAILEQLGDGDATVADLTGLFAITQQAVSKHLRGLERAGLISRGREPPVRRARRIDFARPGGSGSAVSPRTRTARPRRHVDRRAQPDLGGPP